jgi:hypothetical protein
VISFVTLQAFTFPSPHTSHHRPFQSRIFPYHPCLLRPSPSSIPHSAVFPSGGLLTHIVESADFFHAFFKWGIPIVFCMINICGIVLNTQYVEYHIRTIKVFYLPTDAL